MMTAMPESSRTRVRTKPRWRQLAKSLVPDVYEETLEKKPSTYEFFIYLKRACWDAHEANDSQQLCKIYAFAYWAFDHPAKDLWNPAGVTFFEDLFDNCKTFEDVLQITPWLRHDMLEASIELMKFVGYSDNLIDLVTKAAKIGDSSKVGDVNRTLQIYLTENGVH